MSFQIEPAAQQELEEAAEWYGAIRLALAAEFLAEFDRGVQMIVQAPNAWHPVGVACGAIVSTNFLTALSIIRAPLKS